MKSKLLFCGFLALATLTAVSVPPPAVGNSSALKNAVILVIRHAEKPDHGSGLSPAGETHARAYVSYFKNLTIDGQPLTPDYLFASKDSSASHRPRLTLEPTAKALGLKIDSRFNDNQAQELARELQSRTHGTNILVCWRHGEIPQLLRALGAEPEKLLPNSKWPDEVFGWLILLRYDENGHLCETKRINEDMSPSPSTQARRHVRHSPKSDGGSQR